MKNSKRCLAAACAALEMTIIATAAVMLPRSASAQITFDFIGPHDYDLPLIATPWNVFVQYGTEQNSNEAWNSQGHPVSVDPGVHSTVGLSKWVHFFTVDSLPTVGMGFELVQPEVNIRTNERGPLNAHTESGFGDTIIGYLVWYKPTERSTLGFQTFLQMPVGGAGVSDTNWKNLSNVLWYVPIGDNFSWTGDAGWVVQSTRDSGVHPGLTWNTNNRFGYKLGPIVEPFLALDYEHTAASSVRLAPALPAGHALDPSAGILFNTFKNQNIAFRYSHGVEGKNHALTNAGAIEYVLVF